jgi:hypothetical protein
MSVLFTQLHLTVLISVQLLALLYWYPVQFTDYCITIQAKLEYSVYQATPDCTDICASPDSIVLVSSTVDRLLC